MTGNDHFLRTDPECPTGLTPNAPPRTDPECPTALTALMRKLILLANNLLKNPQLTLAI